MCCCLMARFRTENSVLVSVYFLETQPVNLQNSRIVVGFFVRSAHAPGGCCLRRKSGESPESLAAHPTRRKSMGKRTRNERPNRRGKKRCSKSAATGWLLDFAERVWHRCNSGKARAPCGFKVTRNWSDAIPVHIGCVDRTEVAGGSELLVEDTTFTLVLVLTEHDRQRVKAVRSKTARHHSKQVRLARRELAAAGARSKSRDNRDYDFAVAG
ncbi:MAG: hypothetical protein HKM24_07745 [Gammaproteobacteria bacterium]|nr:hypothetical protein [Gammaproteobacteria bacterium]